MAREGRDVQLARRAGPVRSFLRGTAVSVRELRIDKERLVEATGVTVIGAIGTAWVGSLFETTAPFAHQGICEISVEVLGASLAPWAVYGTIVGAGRTARAIKRAGHHMVEKGRADISDARGLGD